MSRSTNISSALCNYCLLQGTKQWKNQKSECLYFNNQLHCSFDMERSLST